MTTSADPLAGIGSIDWGRLHHAYGPATDVPDQLRELRSLDGARRSEALSQLFGNVYHQGTRWQASHVVVPFLVALVDDSVTPDRAAVLGLLTAIAIGDRRDDELPFDPGRALTLGGSLGGIDIDTSEVILRFYAGDDLTGEENNLLEAEALRWEADCYFSTAHFLPTIVGWVSDPDDQVAAQAAALTAWFAPTAATVSALIAVPEHRAQPRASANLALAHMAYADPRIEQRLRQSAVSGIQPVAVTAAVALAYREGESLADQALSILVDVAGRDSVEDVAGWDRALRGFVMVALHRLGLG